MSNLANRIYDVLVAEAGASEYFRQDFLYHFGTHEFRFGGDLGFGGKFWIGRKILK